MTKAKPTVVTLGTIAGPPHPNGGTWPHKGGNLELPLDAVTQTFGVVGRRGSGKTYTALVIAEDLIAAGLPVVMLDPLGVGWGLRSSSSGKAAGLPVTILGGDHGDIALVDTAGELVANLVVEHPGSYVLDLSHFESNAAQDRFATAFAERLYRAKAKDRTPLKLVVDEADSFAPQRPQRGQERMLGAFEALSRRGRVRGIGVDLITQRPAVLNKNVLTQVECLVTMQITAPQDRKAVEAWIVGNDDRGQADTVLGSLAALEVGQAWVWSPQWLRTLELVNVRPRRTFDSSSTPEAGEVLEPARMAPVDLEGLEAAMAKTLEKTKADDPKLLRKRIAELERNLKAKPDVAPDPVEVEVRVEVPVLTDDDRKAFAEALEVLRDDLAEVATVGARLADVLEATTAPAKTKTAPPAARPSRPPARPARAPAAKTAPPPARSSSSSSNGSGDVELKAGARRILETLARHHPMKVTRAQAGALVGMKITGGTFGTYWSKLKTEGLIDEAGGEVTVTELGLDVAGVEPAAPATTEEVLEVWRKALKAGARRMLDLLVDRHPDGLTRDELGLELEMVPTGGTFGTYLSTLRRNGLIDEADGVIYASDSLFLGDPT